MKTMKKLVALLLCFAMVFCFAACGEKQAEEETEPVDDNTPQYGGVMKVHKDSSPAGFCSLIRSVGAGYTSGCVEMLAKKNIITNEVTPVLAESWTYDEETFTVTAKIRQGIKFHDGSDLTAEVVKWNFDTAKENKMLSSYHNFDSEVVDEYTIKIIFDKFYIDWEASALASVSLYSKKAFDDYGIEYLDSHPVGTGAFVFQEYLVDQKVTYVKNEDYWQEGLPYLDGYEVYCITDSNAAMTAFVNGDIDTFRIGDVAIIEDLLSNGYVDKNEKIPTSATCYMVYPNCVLEDSPWSDVNVRKAVFIYGLDYDSMFTLASSGRGSTLHSLSVENSLLYDEEINSYYTYDLEKAKQMLADAGYADGFETSILATAIGKNLATVLQDQLKNLGITASVEIVSGGDTKRYDSSIEGLKINANTTTWDITNKPLGNNFTPLSVAGVKTQGGAVMGYYSDTYLDLYKKAANATTYEERAQYGIQALRQLYTEDCTVTVCYSSYAAQFINDNLHDSGCQYNRPAPTTAWFSSTN